MIRTRTIKAYAKINLYLDITGKRDDGYHNISSIMQQVSLFDYVTVMKTDSKPGTKSISITCTDKSIPTDGTNTVYKCAEAYFKYFDIESYDIKIHIDKRIPHGAGLAGGSTDGAAVLKMLPVLFDTKIDKDVLCRIGRTVGADIPFCIIGGTCLAEGIGDALTPLVRSFNCPVLIAVPSERVLTANAYKLIDEKYRCKLSSELFTSADNSHTEFLNSVEIPKKLYNIFESVIFPEADSIAEIKQKMLDYGAASALMTGSGSAVFGLFESENELEVLCDHLTEQGIWAYKCRFTN